MRLRVIQRVEPLAVNGHAQLLARGHNESFIRIRLLTAQLEVTMCNGEVESGFAEKMKHDHGIHATADSH